MTAFIALTSKDLRVFASDRRAVVVTLLVPLALASFMGAVTGGGGGAGKIDVAVVDEDGSALSRKIAGALAAEPNFAPRTVGAAEARELVKRGKVSVAVLFPPGFGTAAPKALFGGGEKPALTLLYDPSDQAELGMARGILTQHAMEAVSSEVFAGDSGAATMRSMLDDVTRSTELDPASKRTLGDLFTSVLALNEQQTRSATAAKGGLTLPYTTHEEAVSAGETRYNAYAHSFAGMAVQFLLFLSIETGTAILVERQRGLWRRLRAAPLSRRTVLAARALSGAILAGAILAVLFVFARLVFGVRIEGSFAGFVLVAAAFALTSSTFGLLLATTANTPQAMRGGATFVVLVLTMLGGAWLPSFLFPPWMQTATLVTPTRWAMDGFEAMTWRGLPLEAALLPAGALLAFAAVFAAVAVARFRWEGD